MPTIRHAFVRVREHLRCFVALASFAYRLWVKKKRKGFDKNFLHEKFHFT